MANESTAVLAAAYASEDAAKTILDTLHDMHRGATISLEDSTLVTRGDEGQPHHLGGIGAAVGAALEHVVDRGITRENAQAVVDQLQPGEVAVIALVRPEDTVSTMSALQGHEGRIVAAPVTEDAIKDAFQAEASNLTPTDPDVSVDPGKSERAQPPID
jgi:uncharacterized membrane protein